MKKLTKLDHCRYKNWPQWWFVDVLGLKYVYLCFFYDFTSFCKVFINIYKYANKMIYLSKRKTTCV